MSIDRGIALLAFALALWPLAAAAGLEGEVGPAVPMDPDAVDCPLPEGPLQGEVQLDPGCIYRQRVELAESDTTLDCRGAQIRPERGRAIRIVGPVQRVTVRDCYLGGGGLLVRGVDIEPGEDGDATRTRSSTEVLIERVHVLASHMTGMFIGNHVVGATVRDCLVENTESCGIYLEYGSQSNRIEHNLIRNAGHEVGGLPRQHWWRREGIAVDASAHNTIVGNELHHNAFGGVFLYKNCWEYHSTDPNGPQRIQHAHSNLIADNHFHHMPIGVWVAARQARDLGAWDCGDPTPYDNPILLDEAFPPDYPVSQGTFPAPYDVSAEYLWNELEGRPCPDDDCSYEREAVYIWPDFAENNTVRGNLFEDLELIGVRIEDDDTTVERNVFLGAYDHIYLGTPFRARYLDQPVARTRITHNLFKAPDATRYDAHLFTVPGEHRDTIIRENALACRAENGAWQACPEPDTEKSRSSGCAHRPLNGAPAGLPVFLGLLLGLLLVQRRGFLLLGAGLLVGLALWLGSGGPVAAAERGDGQLEPRRCGEVWRGPSPAQRRAAAVLVAGEALEPEMAGRLLGSLICVELRVDEKPSVQHGLGWQVRLFDDGLRPLSRLFAELTGCRQVDRPPTQLPTRRQVACPARAMLELRLDDELVPPATEWRAGRDPEGPDGPDGPEDPRPDRLLRFHVRYPTAGSHRLSLSYRVLIPPGPKAAAGAGRDPLTLTLRRTRELQVADDGRGGGRSLRDADLARELERELTAELARPIGPPTRVGWKSIMTIDDPEQRDADLAYRIAVYGKGPKGARAPIAIAEAPGRKDESSAPDRFISDRYSDPANVMLDLSSLPRGVSQLVVRLQPDAALAAGHPSARPWLAEPLELSPLWVIRDPQALDVGWAAELGRALAESRQRSVRLEAMRLLAELGPQAAPALEALRGVLRDRDRWLTAAGEAHPEALAALAGLRAMGAAAGPAVAELRALIDAQLDPQRLPQDLPLDLLEVAVADLGRLGDAADAGRLTTLIWLFGPTPRGCPPAVTERWGMSCAEVEALGRDPDRAAPATTAPLWAAAQQAAARLGIRPCHHGLALLSMPRLALVCRPDRTWRRVELEPDQRPLPGSAVRSRAARRTVFLAQRHRGAFKTAAAEDSLSLVAVPDEADQPVLEYRLVLRDGCWRPGHAPGLSLRGRRIEILTVARTEDRIAIELPRPGKLPDKARAAADAGGIVELRAVSRFCRQPRHAARCRAGGVAR